MWPPYLWRGELWLQSKQPFSSYIQSLDLCQGGASIFTYKNRGHWLLCFWQAVWTAEVATTGSKQPHESRRMTASGIEVQEQWPQAPLFPAGSTNWRWQLNDEALNSAAAIHAATQGRRPTFSCTDHIGRVEMAHGNWTEDFFPYSRSCWNVSFQWCVSQSCNWNFMINGMCHFSDVFRRA